MAQRLLEARRERDGIPNLPTTTVRLECTNGGRRVNEPPRWDALGLNLKTRCEAGSVRVVQLSM